MCLWRCRIVVLCLTVSCYSVRMAVSCATKENRHCLMHSPHSLLHCWPAVRHRPTAWLSMLRTVEPSGSNTTTEALLLQAVFLSHGGLTTLGVNTLNMAMPAVACHYVFGRKLDRAKERRALLCGFAAGAAGVMLASVMGGISLAISDREFIPAAMLIVLIHLPVAGVEGIVTASAVGFIRKVRPKILLVN